MNREKDPSDPDFVFRPVRIFIVNKELRGEADLAPEPRKIVSIKKNVKKREVKK